MNIKTWIKKKIKQDSRFIIQSIKDIFRKPKYTSAIDLPKIGKNEYFAIWIGHATILFHFNGIWILTDPAMGNRIGVNIGKFVIGPKRYASTPINISKLPPISLILISHAHMDHLDIYTLRRILRSDTVICPRNCLDLITPNISARRYIELNANEKLEITFGKKIISITSFLLKHPTSRWRFDKGREGLGYSINNADKSILFIGDTSYSSDYNKLSCSSFDIGALPIGGYNPFIHNHCTPEEALRMAGYMNVKKLLPIQYSTFKLSHEPMNEPLERLQKIILNSPTKLSNTTIGSINRY